MKTKTVKNLSIKINELPVDIADNVDKINYLQLTISNKDWICREILINNEHKDFEIIKDSVIINKEQLELIIKNLKILTDYLEDDLEKNNITLTKSSEQQLKLFILQNRTLEVILNKKIK